MEPTKAKDHEVKVLVLNPPSPDDSYINRDQMGGMGQKISFGKDAKTRLLSRLKGKFIHQPVVQLVYIATILENLYPTLVIDALNDEINLEETLSKIEKFKPSHVFMACSSSGIQYEKNTVAKGIKDLFPNVKIISVGDTIPNLIEMMGNPLDIAIIGEVEKSVLEICKGTPLKDIQGIIYLKNNKKITNKAAELLSGNDLDILPFPNWSLFNFKNFTYYPLISVEPVASMLSSRGCPYGCEYCSYTKNMGIRWRARSAKNVVDEIENNVKKYGFKGILFRDPLFSLDKQRVEEMCNLIVERKLEIQFVLETRPELLNEALIDKLAIAGCKGINMGVEDIHPETLKNVGRKSIDTDLVMKVVKYAEKKGIRTTCFFILGLPGTTRKLMDETIEFSKKLNPSHAEYKVLTPYPGTAIYERAKNEGWVKEESYDKLGGYSSVIKINEELNSEYLDNLSSKAFKQFYYRKNYVLKEIARGTAFSKARIVTKNLFRLWSNNKNNNYSVSYKGNKTKLDSLQN